MLTKTNLHKYQLRAIDHVIKVPKSALFIEMGLGKSISTLTAIDELMNDHFSVNKVLIIAPLRVANTVWHTEAKNWDHVKHLTFSLITGPLKSRLTALQRSADIYVINRENVKWLVDKYHNNWQWDMVVIDESSSFKSHSSQRFKALKKVLPSISRMVLLTGTPASNGYMDLWSQMYLLDQGERLGRNITAFRQRFFDRDFMGYNYVLRKSADDKIKELLADKVLSMQGEDYLDLPPYVSTVLGNKLEGKLLKEYNEFEKEMILAITDTDEKITAMSAATLTNKLLQFCSGAVYDSERNVHQIHDLKIDTLKEIMEENPDDNILIAYNFKHELARLVEAFPEATVLDKEGVAVEAWNRGEVKMLLAHPASAGHGLNIQHGGSLIVWFGFTWSLELYQQFNARLYRQGQTSVVRIMHIAVGEVEHRLMATLAQKDVTQDDLLKSLK